MTPLDLARQRLLEATTARNKAQETCRTLRRTGAREAVEVELGREG